MNISQKFLVGGIPTPLKNMKVSRDDDIPNLWKNKSHVPNHQPVNNHKQDTKNRNNLCVFDWNKLHGAWGIYIQYTIMTGGRVKTPKKNMLFGETMVRWCQMFLYPLVN